MNEVRFRMVKCDGSEASTREAHYAVFLPQFRPYSISVIYLPPQASFSGDARVRTTATNAASPDDRL